MWFLIHLFPHKHSWKGFPAICYPQLPFHFRFAMKCASVRIQSCASASWSSKQEVGVGWEVGVQFLTCLPRGALGILCSAFFLLDKYAVMIISEMKLEKKRNLLEDYWLHLPGGHVTQPPCSFCGYCTDENWPYMNIRGKSEKRFGLYV